jgi:S-adenosylmethionine:tRNA ribosyltransferase-isomerase
VRKSDFAYDLPPDLIAQHPPPARADARLLRLDGASGALTDLVFRDLPRLLRAGDLLVFNDTRVLPARIHGRKDTGGQVELLVERVLDEERVTAHLRASKPPKPGQTIALEGGARCRVERRLGELYELAFDQPVLPALERDGHVPLPPYIDRADEAGDRDRYQTVYARAFGAVAAPTAGLHFDEAMLARLDAMGVERVCVTLHVGSGTFQPLRGEVVEGQRLHAERVLVSTQAAERVNRAKAEGRRVVAIGTTAVRALETGAHEGKTDALDGETDIFIYPGYRFQVVDALVTNFHLPESTLLMLVCAFGGTEQVLAAYRHAVRERYRFYSYGDAMFVEPKPGARA